MKAIKQQDLIDSVADALQYISYFHPPDYIRALGQGLRARAVAGGARRHRADPHQLAHVRRRAPAHLPGHRHRHGVRQGRHERALGCHDELRGHDQRGRAPRLSTSGQQAARVDRRGPQLLAQEHEGQHAGRHPHAAGARRRARDHGGGEGRRLGEQVEVRDAESVGFAHRLGAQDRAAHGRGLVPARHAGHRHRRLGREGHAARQGSAHGAHRHGGAQGARAAIEDRRAAHRAVREGECARHRRAGTRRAIYRARREDLRVSDARGVEAGGHDSELRGDAPRAFHARRQRAGASSSRRNSPTGRRSTGRRPPMRAA